MFTQILKEMEELRDRKDEYLQKIISHSEMIRGTVVSVERSRKYKDKRERSIIRKYPSASISTGINGKTRLVYVPNDSLDYAKKLTENYKKVKEWIEEVSNINVEIFKLKNKYERQQAAAQTRATTDDQVYRTIEPKNSMNAAQGPTKRTASKAQTGNTERTYEPIQKRSKKTKKSKGGPKSKRKK